MMDPIDCLMEEHMVIDQVVTCLEKITHEALVRGVLDLEGAGDSVRFLQTYLLRKHMGKEESMLFKCLEERGVRTDETPIVEMDSDHVLLRSCMCAVESALSNAQSGGTEEVRRFVDESKRFIGVIRAHALVEEAYLYHDAQSRLSDEDKTTLLASFEALDRDEIGAEAIGECLDCAQRLAKRYQVPKPKAFRPSAR